MTSVTDVLDVLDVPDVLGLFPIINLVIPRRGIRVDKGCTLALCPDAGIYRCVSSLRVVMSRVVGISTEVEQW